LPNFNNEILSNCGDAKFEKDGVNLQTAKRLINNATGLTITYFSSAETKTNTYWIDGKEVFRQVYFLDTTTTPTANSWLTTNGQNITLTVSADTIIKTSIFAYNSSTFEQYSLPYYNITFVEGNSYKIDYSAQVITSVIEGSPGWAGFDELTCIIEYTKF
jgi:hypothetical protein